jgi:glycosyltransferase involved in cell wall biosynthesis
MITIIVPTLNEFENFRKIMPKISHAWYDQIIVLDGGSIDGTADLALRMGYDVYIQKEKGLWNAYRELLLSGLVLGDIIVTFSPDGNSRPEGIPLLTGAISLLNYDLVIASRYACGAKSYDDSWITGFGNRLFTEFINFLSDGRYTDSLVMFRAYKRDIVEKLGFDKEVPKIHKWAQTISGLSSWEPPMSIRASKAKLRIGEIPVDEPANYNGRRQHWMIHGFVLMTQILYEGFRKGKYGSL